MYQTSIKGIKNVPKECWSIYTNGSNNNKDKDITWFHKIAALKLAKECNEALFKHCSNNKQLYFLTVLNACI
jgi:hypothetical protein